jgi:hypothetical protein
MYKFHKNNRLIIRLDDGAVIPKDEKNIDYIEYMKWIREGNTPEQAQTSLESRNERISEIKMQSNLEIANIISSIDQMIKLSRVLELVLKKINGGNLTPPEISEINEIMDIYGRIKAAKQKEKNDIDNLQDGLR